MRLFSTLKTLTVVSLILTGVSVWAQEYRNQDDCKASFPGETRFASYCNSQATQERYRGEPTVTYRCLDPVAPPAPAPAPGSPAPAPIPCRNSQPVNSYAMTPAAAFNQCVRDQVEKECRQYPTATETGSCDSLYRSYEDASSRAGQQCSKEGLGGMAGCQQQIASCSGMFNLGGPVGDDPTGGLTNVLGALMMTQSGGQGSGCIDQSDNSVEQQKNNIDRQIFEMKRQISKSVGEKAKKKGEVGKKNAEIEKEKIKAQQEADKIKVQNQKDLAQKKAAIDKMILELKAKQFGRLIEINKITRELANAQFKIQQFMIQFADKQVQTKCGSDADAMAQAKRTGVVPKGAPAGTKPVGRKLTKKDQQEIDLAYQTCLQVAALAKKAELKKVQDEQANARDKISTLQASNQQDAEAIEAQKIEFEEAKKIAVQEDKNAEDVKLRTDTALDKSLAEFKAQIDEEIRSIEQENQDRLEQIQALLLQKQNVKPKYSSLPGLFENRSRASGAFQTACCRGSSRAQDARCGAVESGSGDSGVGTNY